MRRIVGFSHYFVDENGNIYSNKYRTLKKRALYLDGKKKYLMVDLIGDNGEKHKMLVHRLVALSFIPNPDNRPEVNHKDGNSLNNCVANLEWTTHKENMTHAFNMKSPIRNVVRSTLIFPNGEQMDFNTFTEVKRFIIENNLDISWSSLNMYGKSRGYRLVKKSKE